MSLEGLIFGVLGGYGAHRKAKDLEDKYRDFYMKNYPYYSSVNFKRIINTFSGAGLFYIANIARAASFGLIYYSLWKYFSKS